MLALSGAHHQQTGVVSILNDREKAVSKENPHSRVPVVDVFEDQSYTLWLSGADEPRGEPQFFHSNRNPLGSTARANTSSSSSKPKPGRSGRVTAPFLIAWPRARSPGLYASSRSTNTRPEGQSQGPGSVWETDVAEAYAVVTVIESDTPQTDTHAGAVCARARVGASAPQTLVRKHGLFDCANPWFSHGSWIPVSIFDRQAVR